MPKPYYAPAPNHVVAIRPTASDDWYIESGPWDVELKQTLLKIVARREDRLAAPERRAPESVESLQFEMTDFQMVVSGMKLRIMTGRDARALIFRRRRTSYWLFAAADGSDLHHPLSRHGDIRGAFQMMAMVFEELLKLSLRRV